MAEITVHRIEGNAGRSVIRNSIGVPFHVPFGVNIGQHLALLPNWFDPATESVSIVKKSVAETDKQKVHELYPNAVLCEVLMSRSGDRWEIRNEDDWCLLGKSSNDAEDAWRVARICMDDDAAKTVASEADDSAHESDVEAVLAVYPNCWCESRGKMSVVCDQRGGDSISDAKPTAKEAWADAAKRLEKAAPAPNADYAPDPREEWQLAKDEVRSRHPTAAPEFGGNLYGLTIGALCVVDAEQEKAWVKMWKLIQEKDAQSERAVRQAWPNSVHMFEEGMFWIESGLAPGCAVLSGKHSILGNAWGEVASRLAQSRKADGLTAAFLGLLETACNEVAVHVRQLPSEGVTVTDTLCV